MEVNPVDPRDTEWELDHPAYRVYFWSKSENSSSDTMWRSSEFEVTGDDLEVTHVISWASKQAGQSTLVVVYALVSSNYGGPGLVRLAGHEPDLVAHTSTFQ